MNENSNNKVVTLKQMIAAHKKSDAKVEALSERVGGLESAGGEPNVITGVKVNGAALEITGKAVDITVPTNVSGLVNDSGFQTGGEVAVAIQAALAGTSHASFMKVNAVPSSADAQDNVLYLVMNEGTQHYDIYAKVYSNPNPGNFASTYGLNIPDGETKQITFKFKSTSASLNVTNTDSMESVASQLKPATGNRYDVSFDDVTRQFVANKNGEIEILTVTVDDETIEPNGFAEVVLLDDTTVDLSAYETAAQTEAKLDNKVDKEEGKSLSANDFTDEAKAKLDGIEIATDEEVAAALAEIYGDGGDEA